MLHWFIYLLNQLIFFEHLLCARLEMNHDEQKKQVFLPFRPINRCGGPLIHDFGSIQKILELKNYKDIWKQSLVEMTSFRALSED